MGEPKDYDLGSYNNINKLKEDFFKGPKLNLTPEELATRFALPRSIEVLEGIAGLHKDTDENNKLYKTPAHRDCTGRFQTVATDLSNASVTYMLQQLSGRSVTPEQEKQIRDALGRIEDATKIIYGALGQKLPSGLDFMLKKAKQQF